MASPVRPCRFCSSPRLSIWDYSVQNPLDKRYSTYCTKCGARGPKAPTPEEANRLWSEGVA